MVIDWVAEQFESKSVTVTDMYGAQGTIKVGKTF